MQAKLVPECPFESYYASVVEVSNNPSKAADILYEGTLRSVRSAKIESYALSWKRCRRFIRRCEAHVKVRSNALAEWKQRLNIRSSFLAHVQMGEIEDEEEYTDDTYIVPSPGDVSVDQPDPKQLTIQALFQPHPSDATLAASGARTDGAQQLLSPANDGVVPMDTDNPAAVVVGGSAAIVPPTGALKPYFSFRGNEYVPLQQQVLKQMFPNADIKTVQDSMRYLLHGKYKAREKKGRTVDRPVEDQPLCWTPGTPHLAGGASAMDEQRPSIVDDESLMMAAQKHYTSPPWNCPGNAVRGPFYLRSRVADWPN